jgi:DNA-binding response OmpR family regulator
MEQVTSGRLLIIDNDEMLVRVLERRLAPLGFVCDTANCGRQGLASFDPARHELVITDLNMPSGDGIELARAIRAKSDVPIVVVTGYREAFRTRVRAVPGVTVIEKPFDLNDLVDLVDAEVAMWRGVRAAG